MKSSDKTKLFVAIGILVVALVVIAWQMDLFSGATTTPTAPPSGAAPKAGGARVAPGAK